jgi:hypothetical protein
MISNPELFEVEAEAELDEEADMQQEYCSVPHCHMPALAIAGSVASYEYRTVRTVYRIVGSLLFLFVRCNVN